MFTKHHSLKLYAQLAPFLVLMLKYCIYCTSAPSLHIGRFHHTYIESDTVFSQLYAPHASPHTSCYTEMPFISLLPQLIIIQFNFRIFQICNIWQLIVHAIAQCTSVTACRFIVPTTYPATHTHTHTHSGEPHVGLRKKTKKTLIGSSKNKVE